jgi:hypothetical protein
MPDRTLTTLNLVSAVAIGPNGNLFAYGSLRNGRRIGVFAPGATGPAPPLRTIIPPILSSLIVDSAGYVYAGARQSGTYIYGPAAHGTHGLVRSISPPSGDEVELDGPGNLFIQSQGEETIFADPIANPTQVRQFCWSGDHGGSFGLAVAQDGTVYISLAATLAKPGRIAVYRSSANGCPVGVERVISSSTTPMDHIAGITLWGGNLYALDTDNESLKGPAIFVLNPQLGPQAPMAVVSGSSLMLTQPSGVAVGP